MNLFRTGPVTLHSGAAADYKICCEAFGDADWECVAAILAKGLPPFRAVTGVPTGGLKLAAALAKHVTSAPLNELPVLVVDDVLSTGASMRRLRSRILHQVIGAVVFARGPLPDWVAALCPIPEAFWGRG